MPATASTATIRSWAIAEGLDVAERGRLKPEVLEAYAAAHGRAAKASTGTAKPAKATAKKATQQPRRVAVTTAVASDGAEKVTPDATSSKADEPSLEDTRFTELELAVSALTARVAKLEAAAAAPAARKKMFGRKG